MKRLRFDHRSDAMKRGFDICGALTALVLTGPLQLVVALLVALNLGRPVLFKQDRPGLGGEIFVLRKFRTMKNVSAIDGLLTDEDRLTDFGRILRASSLDELPSLLNVLKGDMSFVGPRPLLVRYLDRYTDIQARRHEVRPGISGLAQVSGRNTVSWSRKFELDVEYVDSRSLALDARILARTVISIFRRTGISAAGHATAPEFLGTTERVLQ